MKLWQMVVAVALFALIFALWTTSEFTRAMLVVMMVGSCMVVVPLMSIMKLFVLLGRYGEQPNRQTLRDLLLRGSGIMAVCSASFGFLLWVGFYLLWPK
jgi:hypothetical protein